MHLSLRLSSASASANPSSFARKAASAAGSHPLSSGEQTPMQACLSPRHPSGMPLRRK